MSPVSLFSRFSISMTEEQALNASDTGPCDDAVESLSQSAGIRAQRETIHPDDIRRELKEAGAWDDDDLKNDEDNWERILWIAAGNIRDMLAETKPRRSRKSRG